MEEEEVFDDMSFSKKCSTIWHLSLLEKLQFVIISLNEKIWTLKYKYDNWKHPYVPDTTLIFLRRKSERFLRDVEFPYEVIDDKTISIRQCDLDEFSGCKAWKSLILQKFKIDYFLE